MDRHRIFNVKDRPQFDARVAELLATLDLTRIDLVVCNTPHEFLGRASRPPGAQAPRCSTSTRARRSTVSSRRPCRCTFIPSSKRRWPRRRARCSSARRPRTTTRTTTSAAISASSPSWIRLDAIKSFEGQPQPRRDAQKVRLRRERGHHREHRHRLRTQGPAHVHPFGAAPAGSAAEGPHLPLPARRRPRGRVPRPAQGRHQGSRPAQPRHHHRDARRLRFLPRGRPVCLFELRGILPPAWCWRRWLSRCRLSVPMCTASPTW